MFEPSPLRFNEYLFVCVLWAGPVGCTGHGPAKPVPEDSGDDSPVDDTETGADTSEDDTGEEGDPSASLFTLDEVHPVEIALSGDALHSLEVDPYSYVQGDVSFDGTELGEVGVRLKGISGWARVQPDRPARACAAEPRRCDFLDWTRYGGVDFRDGSLAIGLLENTGVGHRPSQGGEHVCEGGRALAEVPGAVGPGSQSSTGGPQPPPTQRNGSPQVPPLNATILWVGHNRSTIERRFSRITSGPVARSRPRTLR